jgi:glycosyltransferase involved in cell wall biosynthesis
MLGRAVKDLCLAIPVYNEERDLRKSIAVLHDFLGLQTGWSWEIVVADNGSTDGTLAIGKELAGALPNVRAWHTDAKGRGGALRQVWLQAEAKVLAYMDVDLSADLGCLPPLVEAVRSGSFDLAIGSRLLRPDLVRRGLKREVLSRGYNWLVRLALGARFSDAQCGFKAISQPAAHALVPLVEDNGWFFDTELLVLAERHGCRILDLPVAWKDDPDTRVRLWSTAIADLKGLLRLRRKLGRGGPPANPRPS